MQFLSKEAIDTICYVGILRFTFVVVAELQSGFCKSKMPYISVILGGNKSYMLGHT